MGKSKQNTRLKANLLTEEDASFIENFYQSNREKKVILLLLYHPDKFLELIEKAGSALLLYDLGCIDSINGSSDKHVILDHIPVIDWLCYLKKNKCLKASSESIHPSIRRKLAKYSTELNKALLSQRLGKLSSLPNETLREIGQFASFQRRADINKLLVRRGQKKLDKIR